MAERTYLPSNGQVRLLGHEFYSIQDAYAHLLLHLFMIFLSPSIFSVVVEPDKLVPVVGWIKREITSSHYRPFNFLPPPGNSRCKTNFDCLRDQHAKYRVSEYYNGVYFPPLLAVVV